MPKEYVAPPGWMSQRPAEWADEADALLPEPDSLAQLTPPQTPPATPLQTPEPPAPLEQPRVVLPRSMAERIAEVVNERRMGRSFSIGLRMRIRREVERAVTRSLFDKGWNKRRYVAPRRPLVICVKGCSPHETI